jgi:SAM-dependent methyltransferase
MTELATQKPYWDRVATQKTFTHPLDLERLQELIPADGPILDYGCGYGRTCAQLVENGYSQVTGVDISSGMIARGLSLHPGLDLRPVDGQSLPFPDGSFVACTLLAVLTCIPTDEGQTVLMQELRRVLRPDGILYLSDYPLQSDERNQVRYRQFEAEYGQFGVFRLPDGGVVRHHQMDWIHSLLSGFELLSEVSIPASTMNGNPTTIFQIIARKQ